MHLSPCEKLARSNVWEWFTNKGTLKNSYTQATTCGTTVAQFAHQAQTKFSHLKSISYYKGCYSCKAPKDVWSMPTSSTSIVQPIFWRMVEGITLEILCERLGDFSVIREWACQFVKHYMNWLFWKGTSVASKIPTNWCEQECNMCHQIPYLMKFTTFPFYW
jgi:hypothetical protein